jgi:hypothetical protein
MSGSNVFIIVWFVAVLYCAYSLAHIVIAQLRSSKRNRRISHAEVAARQARRLRDGVVGDVTWLEEVR